MIVKKNHLWTLQGATSITVFHPVVVVVVVMVVRTAVVADKAIRSILMTPFVFFLLLQVMNETFVDIPKRITEMLNELQELRAKPEVNKEEEDKMVALWEEIRDHTENLDVSLVFCQVKLHR